MVIARGVFAQAEGFTGLGMMAPGLAFHAVTTGLGVGLLGKAVVRKPAPAGA